ncbi:hypothetical protein MKX03_015190 [Papaver bracteatum]|nr:hypothetical protein MKX03_015190 [Papaver bracteatum]
MSGAASIVKAVKPKRFQAADIQTAAGWGMVAFTGAVWVVQMTVYVGIVKTFAWTNFKNIHLIWRMCTRGLKNRLGKHHHC